MSKSWSMLFFIRVTSSSSALINGWFVGLAPNPNFGGWESNPWMLLLSSKSSSLFKLLKLQNATGQRWRFESVMRNSCELKRVLNLLRELRDRNYIYHTGKTELAF